jgi:hypothetical protein
MDESCPAAGKLPETPLGDPVSGVCVSCPNRTAQTPAKDAVWLATFNEVFDPQPFEYPRKFWSFLDDFWGRWQRVRFERILRQEVEWAVWGADYFAPIKAQLFGFLSTPTPHYDRYLYCADILETHRPIHFLHDLVGAGPTRDSIRRLKLDRLRWRMELRSTVRIQLATTARLVGIFWKPLAAIIPILISTLLFLLHRYWNWIFPILIVIGLLGGLVAHEVTTVIQRLRRRVRLISDMCSMTLSASWTNPAARPRIV